jgi:hypothetical protein
MGRIAQHDSKGGTTPTGVVSPFTDRSRQRCFCLFAVLEFFAGALPGVGAPPRLRQCCS